MRRVFSPGSFGKPRGYNHPTSQPNLPALDLCVRGEMAETIAAYQPACGKEVSLDGDKKIIELIPYPNQTGEDIVACKGDLRGLVFPGH